MAREKEYRRDAPLAHRLRPRDLGELRGQRHLLAPGKPLRRLIEEGAAGSLILWGPPGSGKTTLAFLIAEHSGRRLERVSAVNAGVADLRRVVDSARAALRDSRESPPLLPLDFRASGEEKKGGVILFIDEVHRFSKVQQDVVLPWVEEGTVSLIGATTENPFFEVIPALRSRCRIYRLEPLGYEEIREILDRALRDRERGLPDCRIAPEALEQIALRANGDARFALNALQACAEASGGGEIGPALAADILQQSVVLYDKGGDEHYDHASAFQKSLRGSDPDAALYWLGKMIAGGEDPRFIGRRLLVTAAEDVGNADPQALAVALSAVEAAEKLGFPEARIPLAQAVIYVAAAPKSNSAIVGIDEALKDIEGQGRSYPVPPHLKDSHYQGAKEMGYGDEYRYPHAYPGHYIEQEYLPPRLRGRRYYRPSEQGFEKTIAGRMAARSSKKTE